MSNSGNLPRDGLKKALGPAQLFTLGFGSIIGVGWIVGVGSWIERAGSLGAIAAFLAGGIAIAVIAGCYAGLGARYPGTGGEIEFARAVLGLPAAAAVGWFLAFVYLAVSAFEAVSLVWILQSLFGSGSSPASGMDSSALAIAAAATAILTVLHTRGIYSTAFLQDWATWIFIGLSALFVLMAVMLGDTGRIVQPPGAGKEAFAGFVAVMATAPFWYSGFAPVAQALGERKDDRLLRRIPMILVGTIAASFAFYALIIVATAVSLGGDVPAEGRLVAVDALSAVAGPMAGKLVLVAGLFGLVATWNAVFFAATRVLLAMPLRGPAGAWLGKVESKSGAPRNAALLVGFVTIAASTLGKDGIPAFINAASVGMMIVYLVVCGILIRDAATRKRIGEIYLGVAGSIVAAFMTILSIYNSASTSSGMFAPELAALAAWLGLGLFLAFVGWLRARLELR